jgi:hypothetical protein
MAIMGLLCDVRFRCPDHKFGATTASTGEDTRQNHLSNPGLMTVLYNVSAAPESPIVQGVGRTKRVSVPQSTSDSRFVCFSALRAMTVFGCL